MNAYTTQEYNQIIANKEWDKLSDSNFFSEILSTLNPERYFISREFLFEFFLNESYFKTAFQNSGKFDGIPGRIGEFAVKLGLGDVEFWDKYLKFFGRKEMVDFILPSYLQSVDMFLWEGKNPDYARALIKNKELFPFIKSVSEHSTNSNEFPGNIVPDLTDGELSELKNVIDISSEMTFEIPEQLLQILGTPEEVINFTYYHPKIKSGEVLKNLPVEDIYRYFDDMIREDEVFIKKFDILRWFHFNPLTKITSEFIQKVVDNLKTDYTAEWMSINNIENDNILGNMTKDQIKEFKDNINISEIARSGVVDVRDIKEMFGNELSNLVGTRFYREEEILEAPELFDPGEVISDGGLYVSKETFRLLNRAWGTKKRYVDKLSSFDDIISILKYKKFFKTDDFLYLIEKIKPTKTEIINKMKEISLMKAYSSSRNINILTGLIIKYK